MTAPMLPIAWVTIHATIPIVASRTNNEWVRQRCANQFD